MSATVSNDGNDVVIGVRAELGQVKGELREVEYILFRTLGLLNRMGLPPDVEQTIRMMQKLAFNIRLVHSALMYLEMATPWGYAMALLSAGSLVASSADMFYDATRGA